MYIIAKMRVPIARSTQFQNRTRSTELQRERAGARRERGRSAFHLGTM